MWWRIRFGMAALMTIGEWLRRGGYSAELAAPYQAPGQCSSGDKSLETHTPSHSLNYQIILPILHCVGHIVCFTTLYRRQSVVCFTFIFPF